MPKRQSGREPLIEHALVEDEASTTCYKYISVVVFLVGSSFDAVMTKEATMAAFYPSALALLTGLTGSIVYTFISLIAVATGCVARDELTVNWLWPTAIAFLCALHHIMLNVGAGGHVLPGGLIALLVKCVIPFSMCLNMSSCTFGLQYKGTHWLAMVLLIIGELIGVSASPLAADQTVAYNVALVVLSTFPLALALCLVELCLKEYHKSLRSVALWAWVCVAMTLFVVVLVPLGSFLSGLQVAGEYHRMVEGMWCYLTGTSQDADDANCTAASSYWWKSMIFAFMFNMAMPVLTRTGGATLLWFVRAMTVPLANILFSSHTLLGDAASPPLSRRQEISLVVLCVAVLLFNSAKATPRTTQSVEH